MGELISLAERRAARAEAHAPPIRPRVGFFFDLASPWTYLAAERVDRRFADVRWQPAVGEALPGARDLATPSAAARPSSCSPPAAWPSAAATTSTTPRSWPRRPRPPTSGWTNACAPRA